MVECSTFRQMKLVSHTSLPFILLVCFFAGCSEKQGSIQPLVQQNREPRIIQIEGLETSPPPELPPSPQNTEFINSLAKKSPVAFHEIERIGYGWIIEGNDTAIFIFEGDIINQGSKELIGVPCVKLFRNRAEQIDPKALPHIVTYGQFGNVINGNRVRSDVLPPKQYKQYWVVSGRFPVPKPFDGRFYPRLSFILREK